MKVILLKGKFPYKWQVVFPDGKKVQFGRQGYLDYTLHKDPKRMKLYVIRHKKRENWTRSGIYTAGFWSRWLLWSRPTLAGGKKQAEKMSGFTIR